MMIRSCGKVARLTLVTTLFTVYGLLGARSTHAANAAAQHTLVFGAALSLTGATSNEGHLTLEGYQLWAKEVNSHGGIKVGKTTYKVQLKYYDDASNPTQSAQLYEQLLSSDNVNFLLGPYGTASTLQDEAIAEEHQVPMVEGNGAASSIFTRGFKYIFGVLSPAVNYANIMLQATLALKNPPKTVAIINANDAFSQEVASDAKDYAFTHHMNVVSYQSYPANATDLTNVLTPLKSSSPDMILGSGHVNEAVVTMKQCRQLGINAKLYAFTVGPGTPDFITALGADANDVIGSAQWTAQEKYHGTDVIGTPANYQKIYKKMFGHVPAYQSADGTAVGLAFQYAIQKAGSIKPKLVRDALAKLKVTTFYGLIRFAPNGENIYKPMATIQIQRGKLVTIFPKNIANAKVIYPTPAFGSR
jgi:branched-chain amino acid transport system substrate-binding protein